MKKIVFSLSIASALLGVSSCACALSNDTSLALKKEAKAKTHAFAKQLKQTLGGAIQTGGLVQGVEVCSSVANDIARQHSTEGWTVKRVSHKNRNLNNAPNRWQYEILEEFGNRLRSGESMDQLVISKTIEVNGDKELRFAKAIGTAPVCLNCHGEKITPQVLQILKQKYPKDRAVNYKLGELRGAFVLTKQL